MVVKGQVLVTVVVRLLMSAIVIVQCEKGIEAQIRPLIQMLVVVDKEQRELQHIRTKQIHLDPYQKQNAEEHHRDQK